jgi:microcystin-dependent protein
LSTNSFTTRKNLSLGVRQHLVPTGGILPFAGAVATEGYLLCDGSSYDITKYADLYKVILFTYGGSVATFKVPDLRGRVPVGAGTGTGGGIAGGPNAAPTGGVGLTPRSIGAYDGDERTPTLQSHTHTGGGNTGGQSADHTHSARDGSTFLSNNNGYLTADLSLGGGGYGIVGFTTGASNDHTHGYSFTTTDHNQAANGLSRNVQPSVVLNYLIKY